MHAKKVYQDVYCRRPPREFERLKVDSKQELRQLYNYHGEHREHRKRGFG